jgi:hypothetical protein
VKNHFEKALKDPKVIERYKDKPIHMALLAALAKYTEQGHDYRKLPWFEMVKTEV